MLRVPVGGIVVVVLLLAGALVEGKGPAFIPDATFDGLEGWRTLGGANWRTSDGELIGTAASPDGGWLVLDRDKYQDAGFYASFRCAGGCRTGVLLRAEPAPEGMHGVYIDLSEADPAAYHVVLDPNGRELRREPLRRVGGMTRVVAPPRPGSPAPRSGAGGGGAAPSPYGPFPPPPGMTPPIQPPARGIRAGEWNQIEIFIDANVVRWFLNDEPVAGAAAEEAVGRYGSLALHVGGGEVRFRDVSYKDLGLRVAPREELSDAFRIQRLNEFFYSWSVAAADFNRDGVTDVTNGAYVFFGPDYTTSREVYLAQTYNPSNQYPYLLAREYPELLPGSAWVVHAGDFTGDGWPDVLTTDHSSGRGAVLYVNPRGERRRWDPFTVVPQINTEITLLRDIDGDGQLELVYGGDGYMRYAEPDPANPTGPWIVRSVSERGPWGRGHGLGAGDISGDGRMDIVNAWGWWEQPADSSWQTWTYHPHFFGRWDRSLPGGATIAVYDVNGDGLSDLVTSLQGHGWGLAWFEQRRGPDGAIDFVQHMIMDDFGTENAGGVTFSQLHGATSADVDRDGVPDFIVGKRYWSHQDVYYDPDPYGPAVLYWYRTVRNPRVPGGAEFVPHLIHNRSGVGSDVLASDLNDDGAVDIVTSGKNGTFIFWGTK